MLKWKIILARTFLFIARELHLLNLERSGLFRVRKVTSSYIVKGKGNAESFQSGSHGAGRRIGRKEAQRSLNLEEEQAKLDQRGILHAIRGVKDLDEASGAYKDIGTVMNEQSDLVERVVKLEPLAVIKG